MLNPGFIPFGELTTDIDNSSSKEHDIKVLRELGFIHIFSLKPKEFNPSAFNAAIMESTLSWSKFTRINYHIQGEILYYFSDETDLIKAKFIFDDIKSHAKES